MCTMRPKYQEKGKEIGEEKREETNEKNERRKNIQRGKSTSFCHKKLEPVIMG